MNSPFALSLPRQIAAKPRIFASKTGKIRRHFGAKSGYF
jgi:hypothetical protein